MRIEYKTISSSTRRNFSGAIDWRPIAEYIARNSGSHAASTAFTATLMSPSLWLSATYNSKLIVEINASCIWSPPFKT